MVKNMLNLWKLICNRFYLQSFLQSKVLKLLKEMNQSNPENLQFVNPNKWWRSYWKNFKTRASILNVLLKRWWLLLVLNFAEVRALPKSSYSGFDIRYCLEWILSDKDFTQMMPRIWRPQYSLALGQTVQAVGRRRAMQGWTLSNWIKKHLMDMSCSCLVSVQIQNWEQGKIELFRNELSPCR